MRKILLIILVLMAVPYTLAGVDTEFYSYGHNWLWNETAEIGTGPVNYGWTQNSGAGFSYVTGNFSNGSKSLYKSTTTGTISYDYSSNVSSSNYNVTFRLMMRDVSTNYFLFGPVNPSLNDLQFGFRTNDCPAGWTLYAGAGWLCSGTPQEDVWQSHNIQIHNAGSRLTWSVDGTVVHNNIDISGTNYQKKWVFFGTAHPVFIDDFHIWNASVTGGGGPPEGGNYTLTLNVSNSVNNTGLRGFCVDLDNGTSNIYCNNTGTLIKHVIGYENNGTYDILFYNITNGTHFNRTITNYDFTSDATITANTSQTRITVIPRTIFNESVTNFNITNNKATNTTTSITLKIDGNVNNTFLVEPRGNYSLNSSCNALVPLSSPTCYVYGVYDTSFKINASNSYTNEALSNFTLNVTNSTKSYYNLTSTTTGQIIFNLMSGYKYLFNWTAPNYEYKSALLPANSTNNSYEFEVLPAPSINITILDVLFNTLITENVTITIISQTQGLTNYTITGGLFQTNLELGNNTIKLSSENYSTATYEVEVLEGVVVYLNAYMFKKDGDTALTYKDAISGGALSDVLAIQQQQINGTWTTINSRTSDITGRVLFPYADETKYRFLATKTGYAPKNWTLDPVSFTEYTILMDRDLVINTAGSFYGVGFSYTPKNYDSGRPVNFSITYVPDGAILTSYSVNVSYPGGYSYASGTNSLGETLNFTFTPSGGYPDKVNITVKYDTTIGAEKTFTYSYYIGSAPGNYTLAYNENENYGLGTFEKIFISVIAVIIIAGAVTITAGALPGVAVGLLIYGLFVYISFLPAWSVVLSFVVGIMVLINRSS